MAATSSARLSDIGISLVIGPLGVFRRTREYIPAVEPELIALAVDRAPGRQYGRSGAGGVEPGRQAERREDLGVLEHRIPADALGGDGEDLERVQLVSAVDVPV